MLSARPPRARRLRIWPAVQSRYCLCLFVLNVFVLVYLRFCVVFLVTNCLYVYNVSVCFVFCLDVCFAMSVVVKWFALQCFCFVCYFYLRVLLRFWFGWFCRHLEIIVFFAVSIIVIILCLVFALQCFCGLGTCSSILFLWTVIFMFVCPWLRFTCFVLWVFVISPRGLCS